MAIELISKIKQKNSGQFFLVDASDIDVCSGNESSVYPDTSLDATLEAYLFNIDYDTLLAFDTSETVIGSSSTTAVLG